MPHILKNPDGTVNFDAVKKETDYLKAKYAQNAENLKKNTAQEQESAAHSSSQDHSSQQQKPGDLVEPRADQK